MSKFLRVLPVQLSLALVAGSLLSCGGSDKLPPAAGTVPESIGL